MDHQPPDHESVLVLAGSHPIDFYLPRCLLLCSLVRRLGSGGAFGDLALHRYFSWLGIHRPHIVLRNSSALGADTPVSFVFFSLGALLALRFPKVVTMELDPKGILGILWFLIAGITAYLRVFYGYTWLGWLYESFSPDRHCRAVVRLPPCSTNLRVQIMAVALGVHIRLLRWSLTRKESLGSSGF